MVRLVRYMKSNWKIYWRPRIECLLRGHHDPREYIFPDLELFEKQGVLEKFLELVITENQRMERGTYCFHCLKHLKTESLHILELSLAKKEISLEMRICILDFFQEVLVEK